MIGDAGRPRTTLEVMAHLQQHLGDINVWSTWTHRGLECVSVRDPDTGQIARYTDFAMLNRIDRALTRGTEG